MKKVNIFDVPKLRDYQTTDEAAIFKAWEEFRSVLYQLPTGGGKSIVVQSIIDKIKDNQIIIFAHKRRLLTQLKGHLNAIGIKVGLLAGMTEENLDANIVIVSIRTAVKPARLEKLLERKWDYVIVDEARHTRTASYDKVLEATFEKYPMCKLLGVDATPYRKDKKRLDKHFQTMVVSTEDVATLTIKGYLQSCKVIVSPIDKESLAEHVKEVANDYQMTALSDYMRQPKYIQYCVNQYIVYGEGRQVIVFAVDKAHAKDLKKAFEEHECYQGKVDQIDSDMDIREVEAAFARYEIGETEILINIEMATEGVDLPFTGCILGARPTLSLTLYLQMVGRGTRADGINDYFILLDCCGWTDEFGTIASPKQWSLNPDLDPNISRAKNKVVGVKEDGSYEEDLTDFVGEVIEMTPEEYIAKLSHGIDKAEEVNKSLDEKIEEHKAALLKFFSQVFNAATRGKFISNIIDDYSEKKLIFKIDNNENQQTLIGENMNVRSWSRGTFVRVTISKPIKQYFAQIEGYGYGVSDNERNTYMKYSILAGTINKMFLDENGILKKAEEIMEEIKNLEASKINLDLYREAAEKQKEESWKQAVQAHVAAGKVFELPNSIYERDYFKGSDYDRIVKIKVRGKSIAGYHNKLTIETNSRWNDSVLNANDKNYVPGEKVWEMLKKGGWVK